MKNERSSGTVVYYRPPESDTPALYLLLRHPDDHWGFAKGHMLSSEDEFDCSSREVLEETGIDRDELVYDLDFHKTIDYSYEREGEQIHEESTYFLARINHPVSIALSKEHMEYVWTPLNKALDLIEYENLQWVLRSAEQLIREESKMDH